MFPVSFKEGSSFLPSSYFLFRAARSSACSIVRGIGRGEAGGALGATGGVESEPGGFRDEGGRSDEGGIGGVPETPEEPTGTGLGGSLRGGSFTGSPLAGETGVFSGGVFSLTGVLLLK